jgi:hypothetical protein
VRAKTVIVAIGMTGDYHIGALPVSRCLCRDKVSETGLRISHIN